MREHASRRPADEVQGGILAAKHIRFTLWRAARQRPPTASEVMHEFSVSRATAYRLLAAYDEVTGTEA